VLDFLGDYVKCRGKNEVDHGLNMKNHRIVGLGRTFKGRLVQAPCSEQGHLQLGQVAQSPVQPDLECFQGWGIDQSKSTVF